MTLFNGFAFTYFVIRGVFWTIFIILKFLDICMHIINNFLVMLWAIWMVVVHFEQFRIIYIYIYSYVGDFKVVNVLLFNW